MIRTGIGIGLLLGIVALAAVGAGAASGASADAGVTANNSFSTAQPITDGTYDGQNVPADESAFYAIELNDSEQVTLSTEGASENLEMTLYAPDQATVLRTADESFESDTGVTYAANGDGTFYVELDSTRDRSTEYSLKVVVRDRSDAQEPNDELVNAPLLGSGQYRDLYVAGSELDYYAVPLNATEELSVVTEGASENLEATLYAPDGATVVRTFDQGFESDVDFTQVAAQDGIYYLELDSTSDRTTGYTLRVSSNQSIDLPNLAPTASAGGNQSVDPGETVTLDASGSTDRNGDDLAYNWTQVAGPSVNVSGSGPTRTVTAPDANATLTFRLAVSDGTTQNTDTVTVVVEGSGVPPGAVYQPGSTTAEYDDDGNGEISIGELGSASADFTRGRISIRALGNVASAFAAA